MLSNLPENVFHQAVRHFWRQRTRQSRKLESKSGTKSDGRGAVVGGKQMDGFSKCIVRFLRTLGVRRAEIMVRKRTEIPGFYRATKEWDLIVVIRNRLLVGIELKSQVGPSFGNNFNNRSEEAIGTAADSWLAFREGAYGHTAAPWFGYLFLLEDCPGSRSPVRVQEPHFKAFPEFNKASYAGRYEVLCRRLVLERQYNAACFLLAEKGRAATEVNYSEPAVELSARRFFSSLGAHVAAAVSELRSEK